LEMGHPKGPEPAASPQPGTAEPGDFTRMLKSPLEAMDGREARVEPELVRRAGKFTRIIQADELPPMPVNDRQSGAGREFSAHPALGTGGGMTRMLESPLDYTMNSVPHSVSPSAGAATGAVSVVGQDASREPGEFTRIFVFSPDSGHAQTLAPLPQEPPQKAGALAALSAPPRAPMPKPAIPAMAPSCLGTKSPVKVALGKKGKLPLFVILASLSLLFVTLILVFALMR
jgi:hypothetical protein